MIASSKALTLVLAVAATSVNSSFGFAPSTVPTKSVSSSLMTLSMLENVNDYSAMASTGFTSSNDIPNIAPPPMMPPQEQPQQQDQNAFFASPSDDSSMEIQMSPSLIVPEPTVATSTSTTTAAKKVVRFKPDGDNGIMMECNRPFPTVHKVTPLSSGQKKAGFKPEGIMMAATRSLPKAKKDKSPPPKESSSMKPNTSTFKWKPAAVTPNGKLQWEQREIDCMPMPAE
ncbi:hypothetical protein IV203_037071 [Nitzschia inconspicua]|uniref:Secreted protein n=1 Tax=Nitzschia inconspicua TaxID=303405 RepID=A0A9K3LL89_9STRA|nr:hypothetical protein IV203_037071 [Nitzschia inconspicua]